ncbi:MAG: helix-turn-helix transcriptional regulator, partial [Pseudomonadota bacterium]
DSEFLTSILARIANEGVVGERLHAVESDDPVEYTIVFSSAVGDGLLGEKFSAARKSKGKTRTDVSLAMKSSRSTAKRIEENEQSPTLQTVQKYAEALGLEAYIVFKEPSNE